MYLYILSWASTGIQLVGVTLAIGAGLYYMAELMEEYASVAKRLISYTLAVSIVKNTHSFSSQVLKIHLFFLSKIISVLIMGLLIFEDRHDMPLSLIFTALLCNLCYYLAIRSFPLVDITSLFFLASCVLFLVR
jgi:hypothetical protein